MNFTLLSKSKAQRFFFGLLYLLLITACREDSYPEPEKESGETAARIIKVKVFNVKTERVFPTQKVIGTVSQKEKADITPLISGRVNVVLKETGDFVRKGEVLALLDQKFAEIKLEQATNAVSAAKNALEKAQLTYEEQLKGIESKFLEIEKLEAEIRDRENSLKEIEEEIAKKKELFDVGGIPREELVKLDYKLLSVKKDYFISRQNLRIAEIGFRDSDIINAGYEVPDTKEQKIEILKEIQTRMARLQIKDAQAALLKAELDMRSAQIEFDETEIRSPITGVIGQRLIHIGERVDEKSKLYTIIDTSNVYWIVSVTEVEAGRIAKDNKCRFTIDALNNKEFKGKVSIISPVVDPKSRTVEIRVALENKNNELRPGMFGRGVIYGDKKKEQITIPVTSFVSYDGDRASIYVIKNKRAILKQIPVGLEENDMVEVLDGLKDGDIIIDEPPVNVISGTHVAY